jgi:biotin-dependent carboxylase-like uncharacterized protein
MIIVERTAPLLTVQDRGRFGYLAAGITRSGPLDTRSFDIANALVGNDPDAAALEGCLGGASFRFEHDTTVAMTGASLAFNSGVLAWPSYAAQRVRAGDVLSFDRIQRGAVWYLAVRGGIDVPLVLGSRATLVSAGIGGGPVRAGARFGTGPEPARRIATRPVPHDLCTSLDADSIPLCPAPRSDALDAAQWDELFASRYLVSRASSRVGYRLEGPPVKSRLPADLPSEPACAGAMQLPPEGQPIVLMAEHPTIGGYPVIGVVPAHALGRLAQRAPGSEVQFVPQSLHDAQQARARAHDALSKWASAE